MGMKDNINNINKVIYFDEGSATDMMQIFDGGTLEHTTTLLRNSNNSAEVGVEATASVGVSGFFKALIGLNGNVNAEGKLYSGLETNKMIENIVKNTLLSDFVDFTNNESVNHGIIFFENYELEVLVNSFAYIAMVSPYMTMLNENQSMSSGDYEISMEKMDNAIKMGKGYYELLAKKKTTIAEGPKKAKEIILRFNIDSFKNNYRISDLVKMNLVFYAVKVGKSSKASLDFESEFKLKPTHKNPSYSSGNPQDNEKEIEEINVYDVLLSGVVNYKKESEVYE